MSLRHVTRESMAPYELLGNALWVFDLDEDNFWWANGAALRFFDARSVEHMRRRYAKGEMTEGMRRRLQTYREQFEAGDTITEEWTFYPDGQPIVANCQFIGLKIRDGEGERMAMLVEILAQDAQKPSDERRLVEALRHINELISLYTPEGHTLLRNPAAAEILGRSGDDRCHYLATFVNPDEGDEARALALRGRVFRREVRVFTKGGARWHNVEVRRVVDPVSGADALLCVQHDVSDRRSSELRLDIARREAEELRAQAETANRAKSAFLAVMSHELRTPMTGALAAAELLRQSDLDPDQGEALDMVLEGGRQMVLLIDDILDLTRIEAGRVEIDAAPTNLNRLVAKVLRPLAAPAQAKGLRLTNHFSGEDVTLLLDERRVGQILTNLVSNALKFTDEGRIDVAVEVEVRDALAEVRISVRDEGIGIDPGEAHNLFEAFAQAPSTLAEARGGAGLGLHISDTLARAMGGQLLAESTPGEGSCFVVSLQAEVHAEAVPETVPPPSQDHLGMRVLIADDNGLNRRSLRRLLRRWGCVVEEAEDGVEAIAMCSEWAPDAVLMDINMPRMTGADAARELRNSAPPMPIIALTADAFFSDEEDKLFDRVLYKPVELESLYDLLRSLRENTKT